MTCPFCHQPVSLEAYVDNEDQKWHNFCAECGRTFEVKEPDGMDEAKRRREIEEEA